MQYSNENYVAVTIYYHTHLQKFGKYLEVSGSKATGPQKKIKYFSLFLASAGERTEDISVLPSQPTNFGYSKSKLAFAKSDD